MVKRGGVARLAAGPAPPDLHPQPFRRAPPPLADPWPADQDCCSGVEHFTSRRARHPAFGDGAIMVLWYWRLCWRAAAAASHGLDSAATSAATTAREWQVGRNMVGASVT
eukprot:scaffold363_cov129-Isochrysis_galbana.AAC.2